MDMVRTTWIQRRNGAVQDQMSTDHKGQRVDDLARVYGQPIVDICGLGGVSAEEALEQMESGKITAETCHIDRKCAGAVLTSAAALREHLSSQLDEKAMKLQLCRFALTSPRLHATDDIKACVGGGANQSSVLNFIDATSLVGLATKRNMVCGGKTYSVAALWADQGLSIVPEAEMAEAEAACQARFGYHPLPVPEVNPACYRGQIGVAFSRIATAKQEVKAAVASLQSIEVRFAGHWDICERKMAHNTARLAAQETLQSLRDEWATAKGVARDVERVTDTVGSSLSGIAAGAGVGAAIGTVGGPPGVVIGAAVGAFTGALSSWFGSGARQKQKKLDDQLRLAETKYQTLLENQSKEIDVVSCLHEAEVIKSQALVQVEIIRAQALGVDTAIIELDNLIRTVKQRALEGSGVLARERQRKAGGFAHHYWYDEAVAAYRRDFPRAKRLTYLALRALEYELQQTLMLRKNAVSAAHPQQLVEVLNLLETEQSTRKLNGKRPEAKSLVLSLRDEIWRLEDRSKALVGERALSPKERFKGRLAQGGCTIRDRKGNWIGQGIQFTLDPSAKSPNRAALPLRCAERLWTVTATIQGDVRGGSVTTAAEVQLLQRNTFASQQCDQKIDGTALQIATIQPSKNLFKLGDESKIVDEARSYTAASLTAGLNTPLIEFSKIAHQEGASQELAGRGLYGEYILLFPRTLVETGFPVEQIEDIIVKFDYLSVDDSPAL
jgi:hypothetical protein